MITIIKSKVKREINGKLEKVDRYQVVPGEWDDSKDLPVPAQLTFSFKKAREIAKRELFKQYAKVVSTTKEYRDEDIKHAEITPDAKTSTEVPESETKE
jgi:hypothetical protein